MLQSKKKPHNSSGRHRYADYFVAVAIIAVLSCATALLVTLLVVVKPATDTVSNGVGGGVNGVSDAVEVCVNVTICDARYPPSVCHANECRDGKCATVLAPENTVCPHAATGRLGVCHKTGVCVACSHSHPCPDSADGCESVACISGGCNYSPRSRNTTCSIGICDGTHTTCFECFDGLKSCPSPFTPSACVRAPFCSLDHKCVTEYNGLETACDGGRCDGTSTCNPSACMTSDECEQNALEAAPDACHEYVCNLTTHRCELQTLPFAAECAYRSRCDEDDTCVPGLCISNTDCDSDPVPGECYASIDCNNATNTCHPVAKPAHATCTTGVCDGDGVCVGCLDITDCQDPNPTDCSVVQSCSYAFCVMARAETGTLCGDGQTSRCNSQGICAKV